MRVLDAAVERLFDYAGMFPPASLPFEEALAEAARFPTSLRRPEMVKSELVLNWDELEHLTPEALQEAGFTGVCRTCLVGVADHETDAAAKAMQAFNERDALRSGVSVQSIEIHFTETLPEHEASVAAAVTQARHNLEDNARVYVEPKWPEAQWQQARDAVWAVLDNLNSDTELQRTGLKVRCAGDAALSPDTLAWVVQEAADHNVPFKATQGLHHPVVEERHGNECGFLGLLTAFRLAQKGGVDHDELVACITESDPDAFDFEGGLGWRDHKVTLSELGDALPFHVGSCSLKEPDEDLARVFDRAVVTD